MKKCLSVLLATVMLLTILPLGALSVSAATYNGMVYIVNNDEVTITGYTDELPYYLSIPDTIEGYPVTKIGDNAFLDCDILSTVTIPDSVTYVGEYAFADCGLSSVSINASVIDDFAFCWSSLDSVTIGDNVTSISDYAFLECSFSSVTIDTTFISAWFDASDIESVTMGKNVTTIEAGAFSSCYSLTSVTIGENVTSIGEFAFSDCNSLGSIAIPDNVTTIGDVAFHRCDSLTSVTMGKNVTTIENGVFSECYNLTSVTIGENVTSIGHMAFYDCRALNSVCIPNSVTTIKSEAFSGCTNLTSVTISNSVTSIEWYAFGSCTSLTDVYYVGSEKDKANMTIGDNDPLLNATWHYADDPISNDVQHSVMDTENGNGLAFRFELSANGVKVKNGTEADLTGATVNYLGAECKLIGMGAVVTNDATAADNLTLDAVNDFNVIDVPTVYLQEVDEDSCAFATRIINIPDSALERIIYARPYYIVEVDGQQIVVYGDVDSASCAEYR